MSLDWFSLEALLGGILIGFASALLFSFNGRIAGISGIAGQWFQWVRERVQTKSPSVFRGDALWRFLFLSGLIVGGFLMQGTEYSAQPSPVGLPLVIAAGLLVGMGTRMGWGCTSGHGVCGLARFSGRSLFATLLFMGAGMLAVSIVRLMGGFS